MSNTFLLNSMVGEYRLIDFLGEGGMGEVYRAVHEKLGRVAAIKVLTSAARREPGFVHRFFNEARIQASLQHTNIAALYDFMEVGGQPCIIMEYVDGVTLCDRVRPYGPLPTSEALRIFSAVADAISYIHAHGVIHRDIKSNNIKIGTSGQVKLLDFGIAKGNASPGLTETGSVVGTLEYLSPEQLATGAADQRSDIWALGVLLYEMMTGHVPFEASTIGALCQKINFVDYPPVKQLNPAAPADVASVIARCLKKNPADRYQSASLLLADVRRVADALNAPPPKPKPKREKTKPIHRSDPPTTRQQSHPSLGRSPLMLGGVAFVVLALVSLGVLGLLKAISSPAAETVNMNLLAENSNSRRSMTLKIEMGDGMDTEIWKGDKLLGVGKAELKAEVGESIELTLRRDGRERKQQFQVAPNKTTWTFNFNNKQQ